jgi:ADP-ribose pyrophosphatase YjhB (NUDIX family)
VGYIEDLRKLVGKNPVILVRPSVVIINRHKEILLVQYKDKSWGIPGGLMELGESVEECARREIKEEIGLEIKNLKLLEVFSGKELFTKLKNGDQYYNVIIGYICTDFEGELIPDGIEVFEAGFYKMTELPEGTNPMIMNKMKDFETYITRLDSSS